VLLRVHSVIVAEYSKVVQLSPDPACPEQTWPDHCILTVWIFRFILWPSHAAFNHYNYYIMDLEKQIKLSSLFSSIYLILSLSTHFGLKQKF
jgi:hypothetical protein